MAPTRDSIATRILVLKPCKGAWGLGAATRWGWLPVLSVTAFSGLWITAVSYVAARNGWGSATLLFDLGVLLIVVPVVARLWQTSNSRAETIGLVLVLGLGLYLVSVLRYPLYFTSYDELLHYRTAEDILQTHQLFTGNSLLPVSPLFPGLEIVTTALASVSGIGIFPAGVVLVGAAREMMLLTLFLLFERLGESARVAGLGTVLYMGSSTFMFFDTSFAYESLGLPLATLVVFVLLRRSQGTTPRERWMWTGLAILLMLAVSITHPVTAYMLTLFLGLWSLATLYLRKNRERRLSPIEMAIFLLSWNAAWLFSIAQITIRYLQPYTTDAITTLVRLLTGQGGDRQLLAVAVGQGTIDVERLIALGSVGCILTGLVLGLGQWWRQPRGQSLSLALALGSFAYPAIPLLRLNANTWQFSNRLAGFLFVALGYIMALGLARLELPPRWTRVRNWLAIPALLVIFRGGIAAGSSPATRLPGPYAIVADNRSIDAQGLQAAEWARAVLGPNQRMAADRVQTILMGSFGRQSLITNQSDGVSVSGIFLKPELRQEDYALLAQTGLHYLVIDRRITAGVPLYGFYFEEWEQKIVSFVPPVQASVLEKFEHLPGVSRILDSGDIVVYDIGALAHAP